MRRFILDTDLTSDIDDVVALQLAFALQRLNHCEILGISLNSNGTKLPGAASALQTYWGNTAALGCIKTGGSYASPGNANSYAEYIYDNFPRAGVALASTVQDSVVMYRTLLAAATQKIEIVSFGFLICLGQLLASPADGISALTGAALVTAKVRKIWVMGGAFGGEFPEWNVAGDASAIAGTTAFLANLPAGMPVYWHEFALGNSFKCGLPLLALAADAPARVAFERAGIVMTTILTLGREVWDPLIVYMILTDGADFTWVRGHPGWNGGTGYTNWVNDAGGQHRRGTKTKSDAYYAAIMNRLLTSDATASPSLSSWGVAAPVVHGVWA